MKSQNIDTQEILSNINIYNKYAKYNPELQRREVWSEIVDRCSGMHIDKLIDMNKRELITDLVSAFQLVHEKKIVPSMRSLQFGGKSITLNNARLYNCSYLPIDHYRSFDEIMFLLLSGSGVGFSVQKHHVDQLPEIIKPKSTPYKYVIDDSILGWATSIKILMKSYFGLTDINPLFDYSDIRHKNEPLITSGGKAPGPEPLRLAHEKMKKLLDSKKDNTKLTSLEVHDLVCYISEAVLAGGIRRAALISLFDKSDNDMLTCKSGEWWNENLQRSCANNSVVLERDKITEKEFKDLWHIIERSGAGEPGVFWTNNPDVGSNPCCEISLNANTFCNLVEVNASNIINEADLIDRIKAAAFIGTMQATYTDFHYLRPIWKENTERDAQIGISLTGIADGEVLKYDLKKIAELAVQYNASYAEKLGIKPSVRITTIKPSGNTSVVLKTSSGVHARHAPYYWRRMRIVKDSELHQYLNIMCPELLEIDVRDEHAVIIKIAVKSPDNSIYRSESALDMLKRIKKLNLDWIRPGHNEGDNYNNVSATVTIKSDEWTKVGDWMWTNRDYYTGISVLPFDGGTYPQLPFEEIDDKTYINFINSVKDIITSIDFKDIIELENNTNLNGSDSAACGAGGCEVV